MKKILFLLLLFSSQLIYAFEMIDIPEITYIRPLKDGTEQKVTVSSFYMAKDDILIEEWCKYKDSLGAKNKEIVSSSDEYINMLKKELVDYTIDEGYVDLSEWYMPEIDLKCPVFRISWLEAIEYCNWLIEL